MMWRLSSPVFRGTSPPQKLHLFLAPIIWFWYINIRCFLSSSLLNDPNTSSPANVEASNLYKDNRKEYVKRVRETVEKSWED